MENKKEILKEPNNNDAAFCYSVSTKKVPMSNIVKTIIEVEAKEFANTYFIKEFATLLNKYCS